MTLSEAVAKAYVLMDNDPKAFRSPFGSLYDDLTPQLVEGSNRFATSYAPIIGSTLSVLVDGSPASASNIAEATGEFDVAPTPTESMLARYHYQRFSSAGLQEIVEQAVLRLPPAVEITQVPDGLLPALFHYIAGYGYTALAARWAEQINVSVGSRSEGRESISRTFRELAAKEFELGDKVRDDYYQDPARFDPARARQNFQVPPFTPRR